MVKRVMFHPSHLDLMDIQPHYKEMILGFDQVRYFLNNLPGGAGGDAITLIEDGRIILSMGYYQVMPGVAEVWVLPTVYLADYPITVVKEVKNYLKAIAKTFGWHRMQTVTRDCTEHRKWMAVLEFFEEGRLKKYFNQEDYILSARLFEPEKT